MEICSSWNKMETGRISRKFIGGARLWRVNRGDWEKNHGFLLGSRTSFRDSDDGLRELGSRE